MQDYAKLYRRRYERKESCRKLCQIRKLIMLRLPPDIMLVLIMAVVFPAKVMLALRK